MLHVPPVDVAASSHERVARDLHGRSAVELPNDSKNLCDWRVRSARVPARQVGRLAADGGGDGGPLVAEPAKVVAQLVPLAVRPVKGGWLVRPACALAH